LGLTFSLLGMRVAAFMQSAAKTLGGLGVSDVLKSPDDRFALYLRAFDTDEVILPKLRLPLLSKLFTMRPFPVRVEEGTARRCRWLLPTDGTVALTREATMSSASSACVNHTSCALDS
jgi:hypothetical protein